MTTAAKPLYLLANWKMFLDIEASVAHARRLAEVKTFYGGAEVAVFPSALAFSAVAQTLQGSNCVVGAQNVYWIPEGGYTGEVSAEMFVKAGAKYALVGHSERRYQFHETNHEVRLKLEAALLLPLVPVVCVGETTAEHEEGKAPEVIEAQLRAAYDGIVWPVPRPLIVAYEPVWAVGTGHACLPADAEKMAAFIHGLITELTKITPIVLYGGSVRSENVKAFVAAPHIDGVLVGSASANHEHWFDILRAVGAI